MSEPFCYGPPSARIRGIHGAASFLKAREISMPTKICGGCVNNTGGSCCYDLDAEEEDLESSERLHGEDFCRLYEPYEHHHRVHAGYDSDDEDY